WSDRAGVRATTLWALSVDNLQRPPEQLEALTGVIERTIRELLPLARRRGWRLRAIGRVELLPASLRGALAEAERDTAAHRRLLVQFAIGYGGREEILDALRRWAASPEMRGRPVEDAVGS